MPAFDANAQAIAKEFLLPKVVDTVLNSNVHAARTLSNMKTWRGTKLEKPVQVNTAGNGGSFAGLDRFNTNDTDTKQKLSFDVRGYEQPVVIPQMEADAIMSSPQRAVEYVGEKIEEAANEMADGIGTILYGDGSGNSDKDYLGLGAIVDDGGEVATYGGLSRSTYTTLQANETDLGGALTLAAMAAMYDSCKRGSDKPTIIYTTESIWSDYEALNSATIQNNQQGFRQVTPTRRGVTMDALAGEMGFDSLIFRGTPVVADEKATSGTMWFLNEKWIDFYRLKSTHPGYSNIPMGGNKNIEGVYEGNGAAGMISDSGSVGLDWSGLIQPTDQYGSVGHIILQGNYVSFNPNRHGVINTIS
jgi:hypothetical protein